MNQHPTIEEFESLRARVQELEDRLSRVRCPSHYPGDPTGGCTSPLGHEGMHTQARRVGYGPDGVEHVGW
jgi:hypothetical protein